MVNKSLFLFFLLIVTLFTMSGCDNSDVNRKNSISSGTSSGSGSSGGTAAQVTVTAGSSQIVSEGTTTITVIITDSQGRRTDATITLTSSRGGTFNGSSTTLSGNTLGGTLIATYKAPSATIYEEIIATVNGTNVKGSTSITINSNPTTTTTHTVTPYTIGTQGTITPSSAQTVNHGSTTIFIVNPNSGITASVSGTCGGGLVGTIYTTNSITSDCTVIANFTSNTTTTHTVTPYNTNTTNGSITPSSAQTVNHGSTTIFVLQPKSGYTGSVSGTCGGTLVGTTYTTNSITSDCTVIADFN